MKTAFVYAVENLVSTDSAEIAQSFDGTKLQYDTNHIVVLEASRSEDDLMEFHEQVIEYANAHKCVEVYFYGLDIQFIRRVVFELLALGAAVVFHLTPVQRDFVWSQIA